MKVSFVNIIDKFHRFKRIMDEYRKYKKYNVQESVTTINDTTTIINSKAAMAKE